MAWVHEWCIGFSVSCRGQVIFEGFDDVVRPHITRRIFFAQPVDPGGYYMSLLLIHSCTNKFPQEFHKYEALITEQNATPSQHLSLAPQLPAPSFS